MLGIVPSVGVRVCLGVPFADPESLKDVTELLKPPLKKLESILTGEAGLELFAFSPLIWICSDLRILVLNDINGPAREGLLQ